MSFFKSLPADAGPGNIFTKYADIYRPWSEVSQALMNGPSPLSPGEREMIAAYVVGLAKCRYAYAAHTAAAYAWGIEEGLIDKLLDDLDAAPVEDRFKPLLAFVRKLTLTPSEMTQADADAVFRRRLGRKRGCTTRSRWTARMSFMNRLVEGFGFTPMDPEKARENARQRVNLGYLNLYPEFADKE